MQLKQLSFAIGRALVGAGAVLCATLPLVGSGQQTASGYTVPRTAWGDPDRAGKWPGTDMVGVPRQRDEKLGLRNELTDEEFAEREQRAACDAAAKQSDYWHGEGGGVRSTYARTRPSLSGGPKHPSVAGAVLAGRRTRRTSE